MSRTWPKPPKRVTDTTAHRVDVRLAFLGWTRAHLGAQIAYDEGRETPIADPAIRALLVGRRRIEPWLPRIAKALGLKVEDLEPGFDTANLVRKRKRYPRALRAKHDSAASDCRS